MILHTLDGEEILVPSDQVRSIRRRQGLEDAIVEYEAMEYERVHVRTVWVQEQFKEVLMKFLQEVTGCR